MARGPLYQDNYNPQFSGHETFPLRYGWLKKAYDRVAETENQTNNRTSCWDNDAIARFGVGKNMVASMRHWAKATGIVTESKTNSVQTTPLGKRLFDSKGLDPYMEHPATLWLIHWQLASRGEKSTWFWAFNHYPAITFDRDDLIKNLDHLVKDRNWSRVANATIKNDVACFIRTYVAHRPSDKTGHDDALESPLTELGLIKAIGKKDGFRFVRGSKATLGFGVFTYALLDFWSRYAPNTTTLSFEAIAYAPGSPGRVFQFDENDVAERMTMLENITNGALRWSETAGLKQVVRNAKIDNEETVLQLISVDYDETARKDVM